MHHPRQTGAFQRMPIDFLQWMRDTYGRTLIHIELIDDERWVMIERLMYHYTIKWGVVNDYINGYEDRWCMGNLLLATSALAEWKARGFEGEPEGWHRHPKSGRRREGGDPSKEEIRF